MTAKRYRLWITKDGTPAVIEILEGEITAEQVATLLDEVAGARGKVLILAPEWEVRSV